MPSEPSDELRRIQREQREEMKQYRLMIRDERRANKRVEARRPRVSPAVRNSQSVTVNIGADSAEFGEQVLEEAEISQKERARLERQHEKEARRAAQRLQRTEERHQINAHRLEQKALRAEARANDTSRQEREAKKAFRRANKAKQREQARNERLRAKIARDDERRRAKEQQKLQKKAQKSPSWFQRLRRSRVGKSQAPQRHTKPRPGAAQTSVAKRSGTVKRSKAPPKPSTLSRIPSAASPRASSARKRSG